MTMLTEQYMPARVVKTVPFRVRILIGSSGRSREPNGIPPIIFDPSNPGCVTIFRSEATNTLASLFNSCRLKLALLRPFSLGRCDVRETERGIL